jgi:uncharacterized protein (TIGR02145 family)
MSKWLTLTLLTTVLNAFPQTHLIDARDGKVYRTKPIGKTTWMIDNLDYAQKNSMGLTREQKDRYKEFNLHGRYYHFENIDSVCPTGWRLPDVEDGTDYFNFLVAASHKRVKLETRVVDDPTHYTSFLNYNKRIDIFTADSPLNLKPTGRIEGGKLNAPDVYADYFTTDNRESFSGRSHIHIMNAWTTIHSHDHNMQSDKEEELRKFMVRCVKKTD